MSISRELHSPKFNHEKLTPGGLFLTYQTPFLLQKNQFFQIFFEKSILTCVLETFGIFLK